MRRLRTCCVCHILGYIKAVIDSTLTACFDAQAANLLHVSVLRAFIEQTVARQWAAVTPVFVCRLRTWCVFRIPGYIKTIFESTLTACFDVQAADLLHVSHLGCSGSIH